MTWIDWATIACAVYAALLSTLVAIRQQLQIRGDRELLRYQQRLRADLDRLKPGPAVPTADPDIQAGDPVYWDGNLPGCVTKTPVGNNQAGHRLDAIAAGVPLSDSQPVDREPDPIAGWYDEP